MLNLKVISFALRTFKISRYISMLYIVLCSAVLL